MTFLPLMPDEFHLYDTTLRDGAQQEGIALSVADKLKIAAHLDALGITFIEGGWPGSNPADTEFFARATNELHLANAKLVAFGSTRKAGVQVDKDPLVRALEQTSVDYVCLVAKAHERHVIEALRTSLDENLAMIYETVDYLSQRGKHVFVDCEHFFDGYWINPDYAKQVIKVAAEAGAEVVVLCDTTGGMLPSLMADVVSAAAQVGINLGVHCHNDSGCAVANSLAAIDAGVMHIQGTVNGYGERTGNMDLTTIIPNLQLKYGWDLLSPEQLRDLSRISYAIADITNQPHIARQPYVGHSAFAHKAGLHASALRIDHDLYQHIDPGAVGNDMRMLISHMAGRSNIEMKAEQLGLPIDNADQARDITELVKQREARGYSYEAADASFELLVKEFKGILERPFEMICWRVFIEDISVRSDEGISEAIVKLWAKGQRQSVIGEGNGPVDALGEALVKALEPAYSCVTNYELTDYRVRILDEGRGTDASVRVLIDTNDGVHTWTTVGVGTNVIEASWEALMDSYLYGLINGYGIQS